MDINEMNENEIALAKKNPVTLKSVLGLIALIAVALILCAPYAKNPGTRNAKTPVAIEASVDAETADTTPVM